MHWFEMRPMDDPMEELRVLTGFNQSKPDGDLWLAVKENCGDVFVLSVSVASGYKYSPMVIDAFNALSANLGAELKGFIPDLKAFEEERGNSWNGVCIIEEPIARLVVPASCVDSVVAEVEAAIESGGVIEADLQL